MLESSFELWRALREIGYIKNERDALWWPNSGTFETVIGAILTQNTNWGNVEKALQNLRDRNCLNLRDVLEIDEIVLAELIRPSGFYNQKAKRLKNLASVISEEFGSFEMFCSDVGREWLLEQKGVGFESADAILCYACLRDEMVCDSYTQRVLSALGIEMESYEDIKSWLERGVVENYDEICRIYAKEVSLNYIYARFHGKIVEFCKENCKGKNVTIAPLVQFLD